MPVAVQGLRELTLAVEQTGKAARRELRANYRRIAEPVRSGAETSARSSIRRIGKSWWQMRTGVSARSVYVAPKMKSTSNPSLKRPKFGPILLKQMERSLEANEEQVVAEVERLIDDIVARFNA